MTPETCPGCGAKLEPVMLACPNCPMSFPEDEPSQGVHPLRQTKAYAFLMPALFFAAIGLGVWYMAIGLFRLGEQNSITETAPIFRSSGAAASAESSSGSSSAPAESEAEAESESVSVMVLPPEPEGSKKPKPVREWRLRGRVYDLTTLSPISGCSLVFIDEQENRRIETRSSADGGYKVIVPPLGDRGYAATLSKDGYAPAYLNPGTEGVRAMPPAQRGELSKELSATLTFTPHPVQAYDEQPLVTDFYLAPRP